SALRAPSGQSRVPSSMAVVVVGSDGGSHGGCGTCLTYPFPVFARSVHGGISHSGSCLTPCALPYGESLCYLHFFRPPHRETVVQRQVGFFTARARLR